MTAICQFTPNTISTHVQLFSSSAANQKKLPLNLKVDTQAQQPPELFKFNTSNTSRMTGWPTALGDLLPKA